MKRLILLLFMIISFNLFSQDYPKIELNEKGEKVVVFTFEQAQQIDNDLDLLDIVKLELSKNGFDYHIRKSYNKLFKIE